MGFNGFPLNSIPLIAIHIALSLSSLIFRQSNKRIKSKPMIYPENRLHSIIFSFRLLLIMTFQKNFIHLHRSYFQSKFLLIVVSMTLGILATIFADIATAHCQVRGGEKNGTSMRQIPYPKYFSIGFIHHIHSFYFVSQIIATAYLLSGAAKGKFIEYTFCILSPIQIAVLLMTICRKGYISAATWHFLYSLSFFSVYLHVLFFERF